VSTDLATSTSVGALPRVNLLPPEIAEAQRFRRFQLAMGAAVVVAVVAVGGLYWHTKHDVSSAQSQLNAAQAQQAATQQKLNSLQSVGTTYADVAAKQAELASAMGQEIKWSNVLNDLSLRIPSNVWLTAISATESTAGGTATTSPATGAVVDPDAIGSVNFSGVGLKQGDVATWLDALAREKGFIDPTFSSASEGLIGSRKVYNFNTAADVNKLILSNRYTKAAS
jgi:Tfp pilus assembly protein PilN